MAKKKQEEIYDKDCIPAIIYIPPEAVQIKISCKLIDEENFKTYDVEKTMNMTEIRNSIISGDEWEAENVKYVINKDFLKELENGTANT